MAKLNQNFSMFEGDDVTLEFTCTQADGTTPQNLTGMALKWSMSASPTSTALITKTTSSGITITDATNGVFQVALASANTNDKVGVFYHEARLTDTSNNSRVIMSGQITIKPSITE